MLLEHAVAQAIRRYPTLYRDTDAQKSRIKVLGHLFLTNGNGCAWFDGYLSDEHQMEWIRGDWRGVGGKSYGTDKVDPEFAPDFWANLSKAAERPSTSSTHPWTPYPICRYACGMSIPWNIQPDWLVGAEETVVMALQFYSIRGSCHETRHIRKWLRKLKTKEQR